MHFPRHNVSHPWPEMVFQVHRHWIYIYIYKGKRGYQYLIYLSYIQINNYFLQFHFQYLSCVLYKFAISTLKKKRLWSKIPPWTNHKDSTQIFLTCFIGLMACRYYFFYWVWEWVIWWLALSSSFFHTSISDVSTCHIIKFSIKIN